ncbi:Phenylalanine--tRNA ligase alpha subunit [Seminavis robusta]|uniref:phenylalanine--tRNA ligase n=1 Tax=Seminavis robusta TaxID=568900 RepID=A0A9N8DD50_9STRA|nr:Phenylalanine--tRNA ligase alpha subunit [Seminavis robusta]|eukprot:Sro87_g046210.1 Phenylalanine--tRNA ligase alpha subunit (430) ;mRNA; r:101879-103168
MMMSLRVSTAASLARRRLPGGRIPLLISTRIPSPRCFSASATTEPTNNSDIIDCDSKDVLNAHHGLDLSDPYCNVSEHIASRVGVNLHHRTNHPLCTIKELIHDYWNTTNSDNNNKFELIQNLHPVVSTNANFDLLRIPQDHVSRQKTDTYYLNPTTVLRCHTSAHQVDLLKQHKRQFLVTGDVYRRDEIDASHYPVFHQMEGVKLFDTSDNTEESIQADLQHGLEGMAKALFGADTPVRWVDAYFPFTHPSLELEVYYQDDWLEVLGCGVIHPDIIQNAGMDPSQTSGWAFGLGLERLAMVLFAIPDIRLFWSTDQRFHKQFQAGTINTFQPYSKYPPCLKDMSFWLAPDANAFCENDLSEVVREVAGDLVEQLTLIDSFVHPKTQRTSHCYRITYRSMDRSLTNQEIDALQEQVRTLTQDRLGVELR